MEDEYTLDNFPMPETFRASLRNQQRFLELFQNLNKENFQESLQQLLSFTPQTSGDIHDLAKEVTVLVNHTPKNKFYFCKAIGEIFKNIPPGINLPSINTLFSSSEICSYLVRDGIYTPAQFKEILDEFQGFNLIPSLVIVSNVFDKSEIASLYLSFAGSKMMQAQANSLYFNNIVSRANMGFTIRQLKKKQTKVSEVEKDEKDENKDKDFFFSMMSDDFKEAFDVLQLKSPTVDMLTCMINDDVEWFKEHCNRKTNLMGECKYSCFYDWFNISKVTTYLDAATKLDATNIAKYILIEMNEKTGIRECFHGAIKNGNLEIVRELMKRTKVTEGVIQSAITTTNIELLKYVYYNCPAKISLNKIVMCSFGNAIIPPSSIVFIVPHIINKFNIMRMHFNSKTVANVFAVYILFNGLVYTNVDEVLNLISVLYENGRDDVVEAVIKKYNKEIPWMNLCTSPKNIYNGNLIRVVNDAIGPFNDKTLHALMKKAFMGLDSDVLKALIDIYRNRLLNLINPNTGINYLCEIVSVANIGTISVAIEKDDCDINNASHPECAAPIHYAAARNDESIIVLLLSVRRIDVNRKDGYGRTALDIALKPSIVNALISAGCRPSNSAPKIFSERDFIRSRNIYHRSTGIGPLDNPSPFAGNRLNAIIRARNDSSWNVNNYRRQYSQIPYLINGSTGYLIATSPRVALGTNSRELIQGPYGFGAMFSSINQANAYLRYVMPKNTYAFGGFGTIGQKKKNEPPTDEKAIQ